MISASWTNVAHGHSSGGSHFQHSCKVAFRHAGPHSYQLTHDLKGYQDQHLLCDTHRKNIETLFSIVIRAACCTLCNTRLTHRLPPNQYPTPSKMQSRHAPVKRQTESWISVIIYKDFGVGVISSGVLRFPNRSTSVWYMDCWSCGHPKVDRNEGCGASRCGGLCAGTKALLHRVGVPFVNNYI